MNVYEKLKKIYDGRRKDKSDRGIPGDHNCRVEPYGDGFVVKLHGHPIITAYPKHMVISNCGWPTMTTHVRLWSIARVRVGNDSGCGFAQTYRIHSGGRSLPMFNGIRLDYEGNVFPEDVRNDSKRTINRDTSRAYTNLWRGVWRKISARVEIGEFADREPVKYLGKHYCLLALERMAAADFPAHDDVLCFAANPVTYDHWREAANYCRENYYDDHGGYIFTPILNRVAP